MSWMPTEKITQLTTTTTTTYFRRGRPTANASHSRTATETYREIYVMDADGTNQTQLTNNNDDDEHPTWSPDGQRIAFCLTEMETLEIYVMDADGKNQTQLTQQQRRRLEPSWSPDGQRIAFDLTATETLRSMSWMPTEPTRPNSQTTTTTTSPAWSPDGQRIAFNV